jgi:glycosyltransferase involved in cell wall biosynthesis
MKSLNSSGVSVIMPTYNQGAFIGRAISSLLLQTFEQWELIVINDGSNDYTEEVIQTFLDDERIHYHSNLVNEGLGAGLNRGLNLANFDLITYLPSDDIYYKEHLYTMCEKIRNSHSILVYSGVVHNYLDISTSSGGLESEGRIMGEPLQLVQVIHKKTDDRWMERSELVTDDLNEMFWNKLADKGKFTYSNSITCEWVDHPEQHHKITKESTGGGIYLYKQFYNVSEPIRFRSSIGNLIDEISDYQQFRNRKHNKGNDALKILIVGELAYNPERICALEELGHQLFGLWIDNPSYYTTIGPLPFGNIPDVSLENLTEWVTKVKPDIIYALLNHQAVPLANYVLKSNLGIPFVWHFKEGPFMCRQNGIWKELIELYTNADGKIFTNYETKSWFHQFLSTDDDDAYILDGDLPKKECFFGERSARLSSIDGQIHTVIAGRPYGIDEEHIKLLGTQKIHLHFYGDLQHSYWQEFISTNHQYAPGFIHLHKHCRPEDWVVEFSKYDAGWLHLFDSNNDSEYMRVRWPDLNYPARMSTLAAAGLPMILKNNPGHIVATQSLIETLGIGILFNSIDDLGQQLNDKRKMEKIRDNVEKHRMRFSFDHHAGDLVEFFKKVINRYREVIS